MPHQPPHQAPVLVVKRDTQAGVIPIAAVSDKSRGGANNAIPRQIVQRPKVVLRRLPPGFTEQELQAVLGEEWKVGKGKVSWASYRPGKISKEYASTKTHIYVANAGIALRNPRGQHAATFNSPIRRM